MVTNAARGAVLETPHTRNGSEAMSEATAVAIDAITHSTRERYRPRAGVTA
jgi:hypothetical protein